MSTRNMVLGSNSRRYHLPQLRLCAPCQNFGLVLRDQNRVLEVRRRQAIRRAHCPAIIEQPDVTFIATDNDWVELCNGTLGGLRAFLTGRLKVSGNISLARKLDEMFP